MRPITTRAALTAGALVLGTSQSALAGGFEYPENGSIAMGRGGASVARASDPSALMLNTAGIVGLDGFQITVSGNVPFLNHCFTRGDASGNTPGTYQGLNQGINVDGTGTMFADMNGDTPYANGVTQYPTVCSNSVFVAPQILATFRINEHFAVGLGVYGPNSVGAQSFDPLATSMGTTVPSPVRYMLLSENLLLVHPTLALAGSPFRALRIGAAIQPSFASFSFTTMANSNSLSAQSPGSDLQTTVNASGWFPAFNVGVQLIAPWYFSAGAHFHYNPDSVTLSGSATTTANFYATDQSQRVAGSFTVNQMIVHLPMSLKFGGRFAYPRAGSLRLDDPHYDPMRDDLFDIEIDWNYERSSAFNSIELHNSGTINLPGGAAAPAPMNIVLPHNWHDVWGVRVGSDINVIKNTLALRLGASYEMGAQSQTYAQIDIPTFTMLGLHAGVSLRLKFLTITAAYAHFLAEDQTAYAQTGANLTTIGTTGPLMPHECTGAAGLDACAINVGHYTASMDVLNLGLTAHF